MINYINPWRPCWVVLLVTTSQYALVALTHSWKSNIICISWKDADARKFSRYGLVWPNRIWYIDQRSWFNVQWRFSIHFYLFLFQFFQFKAFICNMNEEWLWLWLRLVFVHWDQCCMGCVYDWIKPKRKNTTRHLHLILIKSIKYLSRNIHNSRSTPHEQALRYSVHSSSNIHDHWRHIE